MSEDEAFTIKVNEFIKRMNAEIERRMQEWISEAMGADWGKLLEKVIKERDTAQTKALKLVEALDNILNKKDMTLFHDCCVDKTCIEVPGEAHCTHQLGVVRGHNASAMIAEEALKEWRGDK